MQMMGIMIYSLQVAIPLNLLVEWDIQYYSSHKIRAYNASISYDGTNLAEIQCLMGHSSSATTFGYIRNVHHDQIKISPKLGLQGDEKLK